MSESEVRTVSIIIKADGTAARREIDRTSGSLDAFAGSAGKSSRTIASQLGEIGRSFASLGQSVMSAGMTLSAALTAPIGAVATLGLRFNAMRETAELSFKVLLKDAGRAKELMHDLADFSARTPFESGPVIEGGRLLVAYGVEASKVKEILTDLGDTAAAMGADISEVARAFGRLKAGDFGEAFERFRDFGISREDLMAKGLEFDKGGQFLGSAEKAMEAVRAVMKEKFGGTMEELSQTLTGRLSTLWDSINAGLGDAVGPAFDSIKEFLPTLIGLVDRAASAFQNLSPEVKTAAVVIAGVAAAAGPVLIAVGGIVAAIGSIISSAGAIAGVAAAVGGLGPLIGLVAAAVAGLAAMFAPVIAGLASFYAAWQTNFGGIRDLAARVAAFLQEAWAGLSERLTQLTQEVTGQMAAFWAENGDDIMRAVETVSNWIRSAWEAVAEFWNSNQDRIKAVADAVWGAIATTVKSAVSVIANVVKLVAAVINGDWSKAWDAAKGIVSAALATIGKVLEGLGVIVVEAVKATFDGIWALHNWVSEKGRDLGAAIGEGVLNGIKSLAGAVTDYFSNLVSAAIEAGRRAADVQSPSRKTAEIGRFIAEGLIVGIGSRSKDVIKAAKKLADDTINELRDAQIEFQKWASATPKTRLAFIQLEDIRQAVAAQQEILKLRRELGEDVTLPLPATVADTEAELRRLQRLKAEKEAMQQLADALDRQWESWQQLNASIRQNGELTVLDLQKQIELVGVKDPLEKSRIENLYEIKRLREQMARDGYDDAQIAESVRLLQTEQARRRELERILQIREQIEMAKDVERSLTEELAALQTGNAELGKYAETLKLIQTTLKDISPEQKQRLLDLAAEVDATKALREEQEKLRGIVGSLVDSAFEGGWKGLLKNIRDRFRNWLKQMVTDFITSQFFRLLTGQPGSTTAAVSTAGGLLGGIFGKAFQGGVSTPAGAAVATAAGGVAGTASGIPPQTGRAGAAINIGNLGAIFGKGGIFGPKGFGFNTGTIGGLASLASVAGGLIGGRVGGVISSVAGGALAGLTLGAKIGAIGGPLGAAIGAGAGLLMSLFGGLFGDPKRKEDKQVNIPNLQKGFVDAIKQLNEILSGVRTLSIDPDDAIRQAMEIRGQIAAGFGIDFKSKKYRNQAQQLIQSKLAEADRIINEIKAAAEIARGAADRSKRILPEFARGHYFADYFRPNGLVPGIFDGRDNILALISRGEMVLNPRQQARVRALAGYDVFAGAGIPNYPSAASSPKLATGGIAGGGRLELAAPTVVVNPVITIEGMPIGEEIKAYLTSDDGRRTQIQVNRQLKRRGDI